MKRYSAAVLALACVAVLSQSMPAQEAAAARPGQADNRIQMEHSKYPRAVADENQTTAAVTPTPTTGTLVAKFTIKLVTPVPSGGVVFCSLTASLADENTTTFVLNNEIFETDSVKAVISGSIATCTTSIPYSWYLSNPSTDTVHLSYSLSLGAPPTTSVPISASRGSGQFVPGAGSIKVPANGATTSFTIAATL